MSLSSPPAAPHEQASWLASFRAVRELSQRLVAPLETEDFCIQSMPDVSPTKWHLAHTSWFFETFVLSEAMPDYRSPDPRYAYLFNSYYNSVGAQHARAQRGLLSRPTVAEVMAYRDEIDRQVEELATSGLTEENARWRDVLELGWNHEQQHQELILMDLKHVFASNPLRPAYRNNLLPSAQVTPPPLAWKDYPAALRLIGHEGEGFAYDNESPRHHQWVPGFRLANRLVTCGEYLEFIEADGYQRPEFWLSDGWNTVRQEAWQAPLYWERERDAWRVMTLGGLRDLNLAEPVSHVSYYEADAYARWRGAELPTEAAWETAAEDVLFDGGFLDTDRLQPQPLREIPLDDSPRQMFGELWQWTSSAYSPYPGYRPSGGALGEYNGKFMCNQIVLRGGSCATPQNHFRPSYRNFFPPDARWAFTGIRLAETHL